MKDLKLFEVSIIRREETETDTRKDVIKTVMTKAVSEAKAVSNVRYRNRYHGHDTDYSSISYDYVAKEVVDTHAPHHEHIDEKTGFTQVSIFDLDL